MTFKLPDRDELKTIAESMGLSVDDTLAETMLEQLAMFGGAYQRMDQLEDHLPEISYPQRNHRPPTAEENPLGAWYVRTDLKGRDTGPLKGRTVALKDNIFIANIPMMNGASILEGFIPDFDATVVTRLLDAGAEITGKAVCEFLCVSGGSATASSGVVSNPHNHDYSAGGSSSGSAALVANGDVDMALGCDQAGSVRIPSSFCGVYGLKPTHGLVPYTGIMGMEAMLDHVGPMTANVTDNAVLLEVLAGYDGMDSRQRQLRMFKYSWALGEDLDGMKIAIVKEGFGHPLSDPDVDRCVLDAAGKFADLGAAVAEVSIPMHLDGVPLWGSIITDGLWHTMSHNGLAMNTSGINSPALAKILSGWQGKFDQFPVNLHLVLMLGKYLEKYQGRYYAKAKNQLPKLTKAYNDVLQEYDLLLMPTTLMQPQKNPAPDEGTGDRFKSVPFSAGPAIENIVFLAFNTVLNTCQFDITGHPALSLPCGLRNGLPVGMMLVGKHFDEPNIYRAAYGFEQSCHWQKI